MALNSSNSSNSEQLALRTERQSARMSKIKNCGLDQYGAGPFEHLEHPVLKGLTVTKNKNKQYCLSVEADHQRLYLVSWPWPMTLIIDLDLDIMKTYLQTKKLSLQVNAFEG